jgi:hypothetical protein
MRIPLVLALSALAILPAGAQKPADTPTPAVQDAAPKKPADSLPIKQRGKSKSIEDSIGNSLEGEKLPGTDLDKLVKPWTNYDDWLAHGDGNVAALHANDSIESFGTTLCAAKIDFCSFDSGAYIIHIVGAERVVSKVKGQKPGDPEKEKITISIKSSVWYLFRRSAGSRILKRISAFDGKFPSVVTAPNGVLIDLNILKNPACTKQSEPMDYKCTVDLKSQYDLVLTEKTAANVLALQGLVSGVLGTGKATSAVGLTEAVTITQPEFAASASVYKLGKVVPHRPFDWTITDNILGLGTGDSTTCADLTTKSKCSYTRTVSVDAPQYWNVGIDITPHGPRENRYALSTSNIVTQSHTIHSPLYAAIDFSPWAQQGYRPYFQAGVPLSGAAFHIPFVAVAEPMPFTKKFLQLSVYGGVVFMQQTFPKTLAVGQTSNTAAFNADLQTDRAIKGIFGIEIPVTSIISKVKSSVGSGK